MIKFITAGESHGEALTGIIEGIPSNLYIDSNFINNELKRRQQGYGRSERMSIEKDEAIILSGVSNSLTTGSPISLMLKNKSHFVNPPKITRPRPGHGDLAGALKYDQDDIRNILERASARETAMRVAIGSICKLLLKELDIYIYSHVIEIGGIKSGKTIYDGLDIKTLEEADNSPLRVVDKEAEQLMIDKINRTKIEGDSLGGLIEVIAIHVPVGLGSFISWDRRLDSKIAAGIMSIPAIKGVEIGKGFEGAKMEGSNVHDEIAYSEEGFFRKTNNSGGIEGGMSNGENIVIRCAMKPIPTLYKPLESVDMETKEVKLAQIERSDVCAVPSCSIVAESMLAFVLANEISIKFGGDSINELKRNYFGYKEYLKSR